MDSLTQIVLGAACGEAAMGKTIGNRALLFGAIGGTIPDLDVFVGNLLFANEIDRLAFHRGFMHSIVFAILAAGALGYLVHYLYNRGKREGKTGRKQWIMLFFLSIFTHPLLDAFTPYGTQLFLPFSNYRVALNTISVVDPFYTIPFLLAMIALMFCKRNSIYRKRWWRFGVGISSFYLALTVINKFYIDRIYCMSMEGEGIEVLRYQTQPTPLNTFLWYGIGETTDAYYVGYYSIFDTKDYVVDWIRLPKNHELIDASHPDMQCLSWFSNGYYNLLEMNDPNHFKYNDLRYPLMNADDPNSSVFSFELVRRDARWDLLPFYGREINQSDFEAFLRRIRGI